MWWTLNSVRHFSDVICVCVGGVVSDGFIQMSMFLGMAKTMAMSLCRKAFVVCFFIFLQKTQPGLCIREQCPEAVRTDSLIFSTLRLRTHAMSLLIKVTDHRSRKQSKLDLCLMVPKASSQCPCRIKECPKSCLLQWTLFKSDLDYSNLDFSLKLMRHCLAVQPMKKGQTAIIQWQTHLQGQASKNLFQEKMGGRSLCYAAKMEDDLGSFCFSLLFL